MKSENSFNLTKVVRQFMDENPTAEKCLADTATAEDKYLDVERALYKYLYANDFDPKMILCVGFKEPVVGGSRKVQAYANGSLGAKAIQHVVVCVGQLVIDFGFRRLGEAFVEAFNYPLVELKKKFDQVKVSNNIANSNGPMLGSTSADDQHFVYMGARGTRVSNAKKTITLRTGDKFVVSARSVIVGADKFAMSAADRQKLIDKSRAVKRKTAPNVAKVVAPKLKQTPKAEFDKFAVKNYAWYRYAGARKTAIKNKLGNVAVSIAPNAVFGIGSDGKKTYLLLAEDARQARVILPQVAEKLIEKSKVTRAKIELVNVGKPRVTAASPVVPKQSAAPIIVPKKIEPPKHAPTLTIDLSDDEPDDVPKNSRLSELPELEVEDASDLINDFRSFSCATATTVKP